MARGRTKLEKLASRRLAYAESVNRRIVNEAKIYLPYIFGERPLEDGQVRDFKSKGATDRKQRDGEDLTTIPMHGIYRAVMLPYLLANDPLWMNEDREAADAIERAMGDLYARLTHTAWEKCGATREVMRALDDAFIYRRGWVKTEFDPRIKLFRHRWVDARNMLIDCETNSPRMEDRRFVAEKIPMPIETAKWFAKEIWDNPRYEFSPASYEALSDNMQWANTPDGARSRSRDENEAPTEFVNIVVMHVAGANPYTTTANIDKKGNDDNAGTDDMYSGKDRVLVFEAGGGWHDSGSYKLIGETDWQYPCDPGEFPYTSFTLSMDNCGAFPVSPLQAAHPVQVALDADIQAINTDTRNSGKRIVAVQPELFESETAIDQATIQKQTLTCVNLKPGASVDQAIQTKDFGAPPAHLTMGAQLMQDMFRVITGMQKFDVQVRANQTAYNTSVQNEAAQVKIETITGLVIDGLVSCARKGLMCARRMMTNDDVAKWVNIPDVVDGQEVGRKVIAKGGAVETSSLLWTNDPDWDDIREEVSIDIEAMSIRFISPERQSADLKELMDYQLQLFRIIGDTVAKNGVAAAKAIAQSANASLRQFCKLKNILNYERFLIDANAILPPEPQPASGDGLLQAQTAANQQMMDQSAMINQQQEAAMTRLMQQGASPESIPADMGGGQ